MKLTVLEARVLEAHRQHTKDAMGAKDMEHMLADNFSWASVKDLAEITNLDMETVKGVCGSLAKKGLQGSERNDTTKKMDLYLTEDGIKTAWAAAEGAAVPRTETVDTEVFYVIVDRDTEENLTGGIFKGELVFRKDTSTGWSTADVAKSIIDDIVEAGRDEGRKLGVDRCTKVTTVTTEQVS